MKKINIFLLLLLLLCFYNVVEVHAQVNGFTVEEYTEEKKSSIIKNLNFVKFTKKPQGILTIECFDVNDEGMIVIGSSHSTTKIIQVYKENGSFQYGFKFHSEGDFGVEWIDEDHIAIYYVRGYLIAIINSDGEIVNILRREEDNEDNSKRMREVCYPKEKIMGEKTYFARSDAGVLNNLLSSFDELVVVDEQGKEHIIYHVDSSPAIRVVGWFILIIIMITVAVITIVRHAILLNKKNIKM